MKIVPVSVPVPRPVRKRAIPEPGYVITACGCVCVPWPVVTLLGKKGRDVHCETHDWQAIRRPARLTEIAGLGKLAKLPDEPMF